MKQERWSLFLGLANRAGKLVSGEELVLKEIQRKRAKLVLIANDASLNTRKKITDKCEYYAIPYKMVADRYQLGAAIGKSERVIVAVMDEGFSKKLLTLLD